MLDSSRLDALIIDSARLDARIIDCARLDARIIDPSRLDACIIDSSIIEPATKPITEPTTMYTLDLQAGCLPQSWRK